ncbi:MAG: hypothetical protein ACLFUU_04860 [Desulfobacteraceae bacterium]
MKLSQRQKGAPITANGSISLWSKRQKGSKLPFSSQTLNLKIVASEQDWSTFFKLP